MGSSASSSGPSIRLPRADALAIISLIAVPVLLFGVAAVIVQSRHAPPESGVLAKAASGTLDLVPYVSVVNIARTLEELGTAGFWRVALAGDGDQPLEDARGLGDMALVLGSEGEGLRRLVRERCDVGAFIPIARGMESLNVSNAAAVALYELSRRRG